MVALPNHPILSVTNTGLLSSRYETGSKEVGSVATIEVTWSLDFAMLPVWAILSFEVNAEPRGDEVRTSSSTFRINSAMEEREAESVLQKYVKVGRLSAEVARAVNSKITKLAQRGRTNVQSYTMEYGMTNLQEVQAALSAQYFRYFHAVIAKSGEKVTGEMVFNRDRTDRPEFKAFYSRGRGAYSVVIGDLKSANYDSYPWYNNGHTEILMDHQAFVMITRGEENSIAYETSLFVNSLRQVNELEEYLGVLQRKGLTGFTKEDVGGMLDLLRRIVKR